MESLQLCEQSPKEMMMMMSQTLKNTKQVAGKEKATNMIPVLLFLTPLLVTGDIWLDSSKGGQDLVMNKVSTMVSTRLVCDVME